MSDHREAHPYGRSSTDVRKRNLRAVRTRRLRITQVVIFSLLVILLACVTYWAVTTLRGEPAPQGTDAPATSQKVAVGDGGVVCPEADATPSAPDAVTVTVLNGTDEAGLAGTVTEELAGRGFATGEAGNTGAASETITIVHGPEGYLDAAAVGTQFEEVTYQVDEELETGAVHLLLGQGSHDLREAGAAETALTEPVTAPAGCD